MPGDVSAEVAAFEAWLDAQQERRVEQRRRGDAIDAAWIERLRGLLPSEGDVRAYSSHPVATQWC